MINRRSLYDIIYGRIDEMNRSQYSRDKNFSIAQSNYDDMESNYDDIDEDTFDGKDMEMSSDAQEIAMMAANEYSQGNIDELASALGYDNYVDQAGNISSSAGEELIADIKNALEINKISYNVIYKKNINGQSIIADIDFMNVLKN